VAKKNNRQKLGEEEVRRWNARRLIRKKDSHHNIDYCGLCHKMWEDLGRVKHKKGHEKLRARRDNFRRSQNTELWLRSYGSYAYRNDTVRQNSGASMKKTSKKREKSSGRGKKYNIGGENPKGRITHKR